LDLFSGSGALSFEALSRGAKQVVSVEKDTNALHFLEQNKQLLKADNLTISQQDAFEFLKKKTKTPFDLVVNGTRFFLFANIGVCQKVCF
jgi:16S rRNA (guanine966-N2)-methyltransferase